MNILLGACNAKYIHSNLAVYDLKACAGESRKYVKIREYTINQIKDEILKDIYMEQPDVVCFSCYIWNVSFVKELVADLVKILPDTDFWAGGPEVSYDAENFLKKNPGFLGVMVGEGEETFRELSEKYVSLGKSVRFLKNADPQTAGDFLEELGKIRGVAFCKAEGEIIHTGWRELMDLSRVPFVYQNLTEFKNRIIYYESSRGCPFSCSYCLSSIDKKLRFRDIELVKKELQFFIDHKVPQVKFVDRTFNCKHSHAMAIWKYITEHDNGITNFHFEISADLLREEELELMKTMRPGLIQLEIGVQSTNPETICAIHRTMDFEKLKCIVDRIHSFHNIHQHLDLIAGLPYEDYDSFHRSFCDVYAMRPEQLQLGFLKVLKGSHMKEMTEEYQILYKDREPYEVLSTAWLDYGKVLKLKMVESMVEVYYNSGQFRNTLEYMIQFFEDPFILYQRLGEFYEKKSYSEISHSRLRRYEILLEFVREESKIPEDELADHMIYDLYLRENLKSRPSFGSDQKPYEHQIRVYRKENSIPKTVHIEMFRNKKAVLFDYTKRDPLTNNVYTEDITNALMKDLKR